MAKKNRMGRTYFQIGQVFRVPLLRGGFAFGYVTHFRPKTWMIVNAFDCLSESPAPPADLAGRKLAVSNLFIGSYNFEKGPSRFDRSLRWQFLDVFVDGVSGPDRRYYRMGTEGRGFLKHDVMREEADVPISHAEAMKLPYIAVRHPATDTAMVEVAVKRLDDDPVEYAKAWLAPS